MSVDISELEIELNRLASSVSVPSENPTNPAAVEDPEPAEDPLDPRSYSPRARAASVGQGLFVVPANHTSPCASAPIDSLPMSTAPAL